MWMEHTISVAVDKCLCQELLFLFVHMANYRRTDKIINKGQMHCLDLGISLLLEPGTFYFYYATNIEYYHYSSNTLPTLIRVTKGLEISPITSIFFGLYLSNFLHQGSEHVHFQNKPAYKLLDVFLSFQ